MSYRVRNWSSPIWQGDLYVYESRPLPLGPSSMLVISGYMDCLYSEFFQKQRQDTWVRVCELPCNTPGGPICEASLVAPSRDIVRVVQDTMSGPIFLELFVPRRTRPCRTIYIGGLCIMSSNRLGDWYRGDKNKTTCPHIELDFPSINADNILTKTTVFTDGRLVNTSDNDICGGPLILAINGGQIVDITTSSVVGELQVYVQGGLILLQGRIYAAMLGNGEPLIVGKINRSMAPKRDKSYIILNRYSSSKNLEYQTAVVTIKMNGDICVTTNDNCQDVRQLSFVNIVYSIMEDDGQPCMGGLLDCIINRSSIKEGLVHGLEDFGHLYGIVEKFDFHKYYTSVLTKRLVNNSSDNSILSGWMKKLLSSIASNRQVMVHQEICECRQIIQSIKSCLDKLRPILLSLRPTSSGLSKLSQLVVPQRRLITQYGEEMRIAMLRLTSGRKCKHQTDCMRKASLEEVEKLSEIVTWWNQWSTSGKYLSHSSLMGNQDLFTDTGKWAIPDDITVQTTLFKYMAWIYKRGYDTFISEIQTPLFPLIEDLDMESTLAMESTREIDEMFLDQSLLFIKERARALHILYPSRNSFTVYIYSSSGFNRSKGKWKSSFHLVWPDVIVNGQLAPIVRQTTVEYFVYKSKTSKYFSLMQERLINHYEANIWENVFDQTTSNANNGLRMPYCNKATWVKTEFGGKSPNVENRRCYPKGSIKIDFEPVVFDSIQARELELQKAMSIMSLADTTNTSLDDQKKLVGDRTQYKQSDKNTIHRTSAFMAGMRSQGGDMRNFFNINAYWQERVDKPDELSEDDIALWIRRGSCRRLNAQLSEYNEEFVNCYLKADLQWFQGLTLDALRETELYKKLTPAGQQGLKIRFRKYQQSLSGSACTTDISKLHDLANKMKENVPKIVIDNVSVQHNIDEEESIQDVNSLPPIGEEIDYFDLWQDGNVKNIFSFRGPMHVWQNSFSSALDAFGITGGYWLGGSHALVWISPRIENTSDGFGSCMQPPNYCAKGREQVIVSLYYQCGKIVVCGNKNSPQFADVLAVVITTANPDDRLYHKLAMTEFDDFRDAATSFPLIDRAGARAQRTEYEQRWAIMDSMASGTSTADM